MFRAYRKLAWVGIKDGGLVSPTTVTPFTTTSAPGTDSSQLPPESAAMSMMTDPSDMPSTIAAVTSSGALRPGICAVVMTTSAAATSAANSSCCLARYSADCSLAYPPVPSWVSSPSSTNLAPRLCTSSFAAARTS